MGNGQHTKTGSVSGSKADISGDLTASQNSDSMPLGVFKSSQPHTTATTPTVSLKTWKSAELNELQSRAGIVAAALADFQSAGGLVVRTEVEYDSPSGSHKAIKLLLLARDIDLVAERTADGIDFKVVAK